MKERGIAVIVMLEGAAGRRGWKEGGWYETGAGDALGITTL